MTRSKRTPSRESSTFVPTPYSEQNALNAARFFHGLNRAAATALAKELRSIAQPLRIFADEDSEAIAVIHRIVKIANAFEGRR